MKRFLSLLLCTLLVFSATGCTKKAAVSSSASLAPSAAASSSTSQPGSSSAAQQASSVASSSQATLSIPMRQEFVSLTGHNDGKRVLLAINVPDTWAYDGYAGFTLNDVKAAEVAGLWKVEDAANPINDTLTDGFGPTDPMSYPEGYGYRKTTDVQINGNPARTYLYYVQPEDAGTLWYPHYTFYVVDDYVVQVHFYSFSENEDDALFEEILSSIELHFPEA